MEEKQWGPWIAWAGGECPIPDAKGDTYQLRWPCGNATQYSSLSAGQCCGWERSPGGIVAYRVRNRFPLIQGEGFTLHSDGVLEFESSTIAPADDELTEADAEMIARDLREPSPKPQPIAAAEPAESPWHLRCAPWTNRFGGWGASL